jgi:hypothetical protein
MQQQTAYSSWITVPLEWLASSVGPIGLGEDEWHRG